jgi:nucleotidyltransferase/DNA polymerase involved in DNA repair
MHILEIVDYNIQLTEEALLIKPIRDLWNADKSKTKEKFMQQCSVLYNMADPRTSYNYILEEDERLKAIIEQEGLPKDFKIDEKLQKAIDVYKAHTMTPSLLLLRRAQKSADKLGKFLEDVDFTATDDKGKLLYPINTVASAIKQIPSIVKDLQDTEKIVTKEIEEEGRARGGNESKKAYEDGI